MRILVFDNSYDGRLVPRSGGDNVHSIEFTSHLPAGHKAYVLKWHFSRRGARGFAGRVPVEIVSFPVFLKSAVFSPLIFFLLVFRLVQRILLFKPDVVLAYKAYPNGLPAVAASILTRRKCLIRGSGSDLYERPRPLFSRLLVRLALSNASGVLCISAWMQRVCRLFGGRALRVCTGVDFSAFSFRPLPFSRPLSILYLGRLEFQKDIRALESLASSLDPYMFRLTIVGDGAFSHSLRASLHGRVSFLGPVPHSMVPSLLAKAHVLVLPSFYEGLPNVVFEAFASGVLVACSDVAGLRDIVSDSSTGLLCRAPEEFMLNLSSLSPRDHARIVRNARAWVEPFTWKAYSDSVLSG